MDDIHWAKNAIQMERSKANVEGKLYMIYLLRLCIYCVSNTIRWLSECELGQIVANLLIISYFFSLFCGFFFYYVLLSAFGMDFLGDRIYLKPVKRLLSEHPIY